LEKTGCLYLLQFCVSTTRRQHALFVDCHCSALHFRFFWSILLGNAQRVALHEFDKILKAVASRLGFSMLSWEIAA
jgi:hypothetical protein